MYKIIPLHGMPNRLYHKILLIMRLTTVLLIASLVQVSAAGLAQKITLSKTNAPLKTVLKELRLQSGFDFIATEALLEKSKSVSLKVKDMELEDVLESIFDEQPLTYTIENKTVTLKAKEPSFLDNLVARFTAIDAQLDFAWSAAIPSLKAGAGTDKLVLIVYNPSKQEWEVSVGAAMRSALSYDLMLPLDWSGDSVQVWCSFVSADNKMAGTTEFVDATVVQ
jgi:hypothetical protein